MNAENLVLMASRYGVEHSTFDRQRIGAIVKQGNSLYFGANKRRTHPRAPGPWKYVHAEFDAILSCSRWSKTKGAEVFVGRFDLNGFHAIAKPCKFCQWMMGGHGYSQTSRPNST